MVNNVLTVKLVVIFSVTVTLLCWSAQVSAIKFRDANIIIRTCSYNKTIGHSDCFTEDEVTNYQPFIRLMSGGISQLLFDQISQVTQLSDVTKQCSSSLTQVYDQLLQGDDGAFRLIDSSAKFPPGSIEGTVSDFGDYDECIQVREDHLVGQYCLVDVLVKRPRQPKQGLFELGKYHFFNESARYFGICFPNTCSTQDIRMIVSHLLAPFPVRITGDIDCVTRETTSYWARLYSLTKGQIISIIFLLMVASFCFLGTVNELMTLAPISFIRDMSIKEDKSVISSILWSFSLLSNTQEMMAPYATTNRIPFVDWFKLALVFAGVTAHIITCLETPLGFFVIQHHAIFNVVFRSASLQFLINDGGLGCLTFLSAYVAYASFKSPISRRVLRYHMAMLARWMKFVPVVMAITALDFTWPLYSSGPFHYRVSRFISDKCSANWWANFALVSIFLPALDICAPHTYYASIDFLTFCTGVLVIHLLVHSPRLGRLICFTMTAASYYAMYHYSAVYKVPPAVMNPNTEPQKVINFLDVVQMSPFNYMSNFYFGLLIADLIDCGTLRLKFNNTLQHVSFIGISFLIFSITESLPALYNSGDYLPASFVPVYIVISRLSFAISIMLFVIYAESISGRDDDTKKLKKTQQSTSSGKPNLISRMCSQVDTETPGMKRIKQLYHGFVQIFTSRFVAILARLSFSLYLSNYFIIRSDYFTARVTIENTVPSLVS